jgi:hypothetical protein
MNPVDAPLITVVSGMPRSGTSLMMRMLQSGGLHALTDEHRAPDRHNPYGYFEDQRTKRLAQESAWIVEAQGKAIKVIYRLLPHLPPHHRYNILLMERNIEEVYASQQAMLESTEHPAAGQDRPTILRAFERDFDAVKQWLTRQANIRCMTVPFRELVDHPVLWAERVAGFLGYALDRDGMAASVEPALYRHRAR